MAIVAAALAGVLASAALQAQEVSAALHGAWLTRQDASSYSSEWAGAGFGGTLGLQRGRWRVDAVLNRGHLRPTCEPTCAAVEAIDLLSIELRAGLRVTRGFWAEVAAGREHVRPEFAAQDVGMLQAGIHFESGLGRGADVWASAAVVPVARSNAGRQGGVGIQVGLGAHLPLHGRWRLSGSYGLRRVNGLGVQSSVAAFGVGLQ